MLETLLEQISRLRSDGFFKRQAGITKLLKMRNEHLRRKR